MPCGKFRRTDCIPLLGMKKWQGIEGEKTNNIPHFWLDRNRKRSGLWNGGKEENGTQQEQSHRDIVVARARLQTNRKELEMILKILLYKFKHFQLPFFMRLFVYDRFSFYLKEHSDLFHFHLCLHPHLATQICQKQMGRGRWLQLHSVHGRRGNTGMSTINLNLHS